jgi:hypothetical protein
VTRPAMGRTAAVEVNFLPSTTERMTAMVARLVTMSGAGSEKREGIRETVIPALRRRRGYAG